SRLAFGVEIEIFVKPRDNLEGTAFRACLEDHGWEDYVESNPDSQGFAESLETRSNRDAVRAAIAVALSEGGVDAWAPGFDDMPSYERWSVYNEQLSEPPAYWGIELVSRVLHSEDDWQAELDKIFDILETHCEVKTTHSCGTHVHVSPGQGQRFSDDQLRAVCKGLTYFEQPLLAILPGNRKDNKYCLSNILQPPAEFGPEFELQSAWQSIPTNSWAPVLEILQKINRGNLESIFGGLGKCSAWNFVRCLIEESSGTIECRRPPGIESAQQAKHWTGLVLGLFAESMSIDWSVEDERIKSRHDHPSVDELKEFASRGLERLGTTCNSALVNEWMAEDRSRAI
ncbi:putative amidoligase enzyme, partial [Naviculisporaceae sp. PSN 640]